MYDWTEPCWYAVCNLSLAVLSSSNMENYSRNFVWKSVKLVGAVPSRSRRSSHLLALPLIKACAIAFIWALCSSLRSFNPAAMKYLLTYFSQDLASRFSPSNAFGSGTLIWMFILNLLTGSAVWTSPVGDFGLRNYWTRFYYSNKHSVSLLWDYSGLLAAYCSGTTLAPVARWPDVRNC
jgi:hypothetical protein